MTIIEILKRLFTRQTVPPVVIVISKEAEFNDKYPKADLTYARTESDGEYQIDLRNFIQRYDSNLPVIPGLTDDEKALNALKWVIDNVKYVPDQAEYKTAEYWAYAYQTLKHKEGDCEDGAILLHNILLKNGVPYWKLRLSTGWVQLNEQKVGHAYLNYYCEESDRWVVLDWCFVDNKRTLVSTPNGRKRFSQLKVGDKVISFNEKTRKIENTKIVKIGNREVGETLRISYLNASGKEEYVECTKEHPFFVNNSWKNAGDLIIGDEIYAVKPQVLFAISGNHQKTKEWQDKITSANYKNGTYANLKINNPFKSEKIREISRKRMLENNPMKNKEIVERVFSERLKKSWKSQPEIRFIETIEQLNLPVRYVGDGSFWVNGKNPDFKVEGEKKVIEITNYGYLGRDEKWARERIEHFRKAGFACLIVFYDKHCKNCFVSDEELTSFVMNGFRVIKIKKLNKNKKVWNIHCEGNNNYFVNGMLVHNCYWPVMLQIKDRRDYKDEERYLDVWFSWNERYCFTKGLNSDAKKIIQFGTNKKQKALVPKRKR